MKLEIRPEPTEAERDAIGHAIAGIFLPRRRLSSWWLAGIRDATRNTELEEPEGSAAGEV
jgi:hypothetical protein